MGLVPLHVKENVPLNDKKKEKKIEENQKISKIKSETRKGILLSWSLPT